MESTATTENATPQTRRGSRGASRLTLWYRCKSGRSHQAHRIFRWDHSPRVPCQRPELPARPPRARAHVGGAHSSA